MSQPEWAKEVIAAHSIFEKAGIDVEIEWNEEMQRVETVCFDIPDYHFPPRAWFVLERHYREGIVERNLKVQLKELERFLNGN